MEFFIRRYLKGKKGSGTDDVFISSTPLDRVTFLEISKENGYGKYLLCARGKGIRGFKKLDEFIFEEVPLAFDAEVVAVKQNLNLEELSGNELLGLMGNMIKNAPADAEGQQKFMADLNSFHAELETRQNKPSQVHDAEMPLVSAGFPIGTSVISFVLGALTGGVAIWLIQKNTIDELKEQISSLEGSVKEAEESIKKVKIQAENLEKRNNVSVDQQFLSNFNKMNGWRG